MPTTDPSQSMTITDWIMSIGIPSIVICLIYIGKQLHLLSHLEKTMEKVKSNVKVIADALISAKLDGFDHGRLQSYSPLKVTEDGQRFLDEIGFPKIFSEHSDDFFHCIEDDKPKTDYDIESAAVRSVFFLFDRPYFNPIKDYLYNHPTEQKTDLVKVAGIYVRDKYMEYKQPSK